MKSVQLLRWLYTAWFAPACGTVVSVVDCDRWEGALQTAYLIQAVRVRGIFFSMVPVLSFAFVMGWVLFQNIWLGLGLAGIVMGIPKHWTRPVHIVLTSVPKFASQPEIFETWVQVKCEGLYRELNDTFDETLNTEDAHVALRLSAFNLAKATRLIRDKDPRLTELGEDGITRRWLEESNTALKQAYFYGKESLFVESGDLVGRSRYADAMVAYFQRQGIASHEYHFVLGSLGAEQKPFRSGVSTFRFEHALDDYDVLRPDMYLRRFLKEHEEETRWKHGEDLDAFLHRADQAGPCLVVSGAPFPDVLRVVKHWPHCVLVAHAWALEPNDTFYRQNIHVLANSEAAKQASELASLAVFVTDECNVRHVLTDRTSNRILSLQRTFEPQAGSPLRELTTAVLAVQPHMLMPFQDALLAMAIVFAHMLFTDSTWLDILFPLVSVGVLMTMEARMTRSAECVERSPVEYQADDEETDEEEPQTDEEVQLDTDENVNDDTTITTINDYEWISRLKTRRLRGWVNPEMTIRNKCKYDLIVGTKRSSMYTLQMDKPLALALRNHAKVVLRRK